MKINYVFGILLLLTLPVQVNAARSCSFPSPGGTLVNFGEYLSGSALDVDGTGSFEILCTDTAPLPPPFNYTVTVNQGNSNTFAYREMQFAGEAVQYQLYTDILRTSVLGDPLLDASTAAKSGICVANANCIIEIHGRIFAGQFISGGGYSDAVVVDFQF